jgi:hypothetical protein
LRVGRKAERALADAAVLPAAIAGRNIDRSGLRDARGVGSTNGLNLDGWAVSSAWGVADEAYIDGSICGDAGAIRASVSIIPWLEKRVRATPPEHEDRKREPASDEDCARHDGGMYSQAERRPSTPEATL